jgi:hypothetical protein
LNDQKYFLLKKDKIKTKLTNNDKWIRTKIRIKIKLN